MNNLEHLHPHAHRISAQLFTVAYKLQQQRQRPGEQDSRQRQRDLIARLPKETMRSWVLPSLPIPASASLHLILCPSLFRDRVHVLTAVHEPGSLNVFSPRSCTRRHGRGVFLFWEPIVRIRWKRGARCWSSRSRSAAPDRCTPWATATTIFDQISEGVKVQNWNLLPLLL